MLSGFRRARLVVGAALVIGVLAACSGVPDSGSVHLANKLPGISDPEFNLAQLPASPTAGIKPVPLVAGFLDALVDSDSNYAVAKEFLAHGTSWNSTTAGSLVYDGEPVIHRDGPISVDVKLARTGEIDSGGEYRVDPGTVTQHYDIVRASGQWRISRLPGGVPLSTLDAQHALAQDSVYFFNHAQTRLVPEPILVPSAPPSLATTLMRALLGGPSAGLAPGVTTAVPNGVALVDNVTIDASGVAEVDLSPSAHQISATQLARLSAQVVWTLRQVSAVTAVRLLANNKPLTALGVAATEPVGAWGRFAPDVTPSTQGALSVRDGRVVGIGMTVPSSLHGRSLSAPVVSADGLSVAALHGAAGQQTLLAGTAFGPLDSVFAPSTLTPPVFDPAGDLFIVRGVAPLAQLTELTVARKIIPVGLPASIAKQQISALAITADGSRIALVVDPPTASALYVAVLTEVRGRPEIRSVQLVVPASSVVSGVAWAGAGTLATTVRTDVSHRAVLTVSVDGYETSLSSTTGLPASPTQVAAAPDEALLAAADDAVWSLADGRWTQVSTGSDPSYPS